MQSATRNSNAQFAKHLAFLAGPRARKSVSSLSLAFTRSLGRTYQVHADRDHLQTDKVVDSSGPRYRGENRKEKPPSRFRTRRCRHCVSRARDNNTDTRTTTTAARATKEKVKCQESPTTNSASGTAENAGEASVPSMPRLHGGTHGRTHMHQRFQPTVSIPADSKAPASRRRPADSEFLESVFPPSRLEQLAMHSGTSACNKNRGALHQIYSSSLQAEMLQAGPLLSLSLDISRAETLNVIVSDVIQSWSVATCKSCILPSLGQ